MSLQSAIDGLLAEIATLGGATNLVNAPAWPGNITFDLLAGTNQIRNFHAVAPMGLALANDNWTLSLSCDAYSTAQTDALLLSKASESWVLAQLGGYSTTQQTSDAIAAALTNHFTRAEATANLVAGVTECKDYTDTSLLDYSTTAQTNQAISDALVPYGTIVQRDAAIAAALASYYTSAQTDSAIAAGLATIDLSPYWTIAQVQAAITAALVPVTLANGQNWNGGPTFNLLRGTNVLRNLSVAGALTATFQNLDDTILIESDSYARGETYTQLETGAAITAAIDALNLSQYRTEAQVLALIAGELVSYWDQSEVSSYVAGELSNYATNSSVSSSISSALSSYDNSSQVDSKIITALLDFYTRAETDQEIANALSNVDLSSYYTSGAGLPAHGNANPVLDVGAHPNGDRRRHRRRGLPGPNRGGRPLPGAPARRRQRLHSSDRAEPVLPADHQEPAAPAAARRGQHPRQRQHPANHLRLLLEEGERLAVPDHFRPGPPRCQVLPEHARARR